MPEGSASSKPPALASVWYGAYAEAYRSGLIREDVNVIWDLATHDVSIFNFLIGVEPIETAIPPHPNPSPSGRGEVGGRNSWRITGGAMSNAQFDVTRQ